MLKRVSTELFHQFLEKKIIEYNSSKVPSFISKKESKKMCYAFEEDSKHLAGISLEYFLGIMHINFLWVDEQLRGKKVGEQLLLLAEDIAIKNECSIIYLETFTFQAPNFYKKYGFEEFGRLENIPEINTDLYFLKKSLKG
ncbi:GNAT family N-acetyltransferase [Enterococcus faecalis]|uniref:GNAT family N-acetyltransferase n=1 Tax=Enterococcus faecalis TaxID=1351 RepID=UPI0034D01F2E